MTLLDAPKFDEAREKRKMRLIYGGVALVFVLLIGWWLAAGRPVDWPWRWNDHLVGRVTVNNFFKAVETNDLKKAYGIWIHDKNWEQHPDTHRFYGFDRFQRDWAPNGVENEYGTITSHRIAATNMHGNFLMVGIFVNGRKSKAINLTYFPPDHTLSFTQDDLQFLEGPGGIH
ncbi:MAG: hypothetical protein P4K83_03395 [Terracidiphilus sp.]|nr:hypothetical protein [Terracidiphilus sp.]